MGNPKASTEVRHITDATASLAKSERLYVEVGGIQIARDRSITIRLADAARTGVEVRAPRLERVITAAVAIAAARPTEHDEAISPVSNQTLGVAGPERAAATE
jgi:hypothetical protein